MKTKKILSIVFVGIISIMLLSFNVNAENISTLDVADNNNKLTVSGATEDGVLAIAVLVYSNDDLSHMETCSVNSNAYNCKLNKTFDNGSYTVKVADYDGGEYVTKDIIISSKSTTENNPNTGDNILFYIIICATSILVTTGCIILLKKKKYSI